MKRILRVILLVFTICSPLTSSAEFNIEVFKNRPDYVYYEDDMEDRVIVSYLGSTEPDKLLVSDNFFHIVYIYPSIIYDYKNTYIAIAMDYYDDEWIFADKIIIRVDDKRITYNDLTFDRQTIGYDLPEGMTYLKDFFAIKESTTIFFNRESIDFFRAIPKGDEAKIALRISGSKGYVDMERVKYLPAQLKKFYDDIISANVLEVLADEYTSFVMK